MQIETKYKIGQVFYMARSVERYSTEEVEVDGKIYTRQNTYFEPIVRTKRIYHITIDINSERTNIKYRLEDINENGQTERCSFRQYMEDELDKAFDNYESAKNLADEYAIHKKQELLIV